MTAVVAPRQGMSSRLAVGSRDDWGTPEVVLERVRRVGAIGLDPCTSSDNPVGARRFFTAADDALQQEDWPHYMAPGELAFVNPPYGRMRSTDTRPRPDGRPGWANFIAYQGLEGAEIVSLVAARPDAGWFDYLVWQTAQAVCFWKGRLRFVGAPSSAPFPSAVVYHGQRPWAFEAAFHDAGRVVRL